MLTRLLPAASDAPPPDRAGHQQGDSSCAGRLDALPQPADAARIDTALAADGLLFVWPASHERLSLPTHDPH